MSERIYHGMDVVTEAKDPDEINGWLQEGYHMLWMECEEYRGDSEIEADSDHEDGEGPGGGEGYSDWPEPPPPHAFNMDLDSYETGTVRRRAKTIVTPKMAMESFRLSFLNDDQDVNFDAILGELYELECQLNSTQTELSRSLSSSGGGGSHPPPPAQFQDDGEDGRDPNSASSVSEREELDRLAAEITSGLQYKSNGHHHHHHHQGHHHPHHQHHHPQQQQHLLTVGGGPVLGGGEGTALCDGADTDSAFSDNASLPSSESYTSMVTVSSSAETNSSSSGGDTCSMSSAICAGLSTAEDEQFARLKAEKIRIALEKIKEAKIRKLFVRAFAKDGSSKSILVDEKMSVSQVCSQLADKNHVKLNHKLAVVEHMPELLMERILEDHDSLVENMVMWTRDSKNKVMFEERMDKYDLFRNPEKYLLCPTTSKPTQLSPQQKDKLIQDFFAPESPCTPQMEGALYLKSDGKKAWKKFFFVLRASGLYYNPKGKATKNPKDLVCLVQFEFVEVYRGLGWKKKYHAPTDFCFALKHPQIQKKTSKYIRYFCADSETMLDQWIMGIRTVKLGKQMLHNYERLTHEISMWDMRQPEEGATTVDADESVCKMLNHVDLHDSRMSVPEPGSRHSVIQGSLVRNSTGYGTEVRDTMSIEVLAIPPRKGTDSVTGSDGRSLSGSVGSSSLSSSAASEAGHKTPVKRVSFSATHSIINGDSREQTVKHRDSIISASTDSSEDSNSSGGSGEMRLGASFRGKMRPKLPLNTETTRQLADMCNVSSVDETPEAIYAETPHHHNQHHHHHHHHHRIGSSSSSTSSNFSRTDRRRSSMTERRGSCGSTGSDNSQRLNQMRNTPLSPSLKQHSLDCAHPYSKSSGHGINGHVRRKSEPMVSALIEQGPGEDDKASSVNGSMYDPTYSTVYASVKEEKSRSHRPTSETHPQEKTHPTTEEPLYNQIQSPAGRHRHSPAREPAQSSAIPPPPQFREEDELNLCRPAHEASPPLPPPLTATVPPPPSSKGSMQVPPPPPPSSAPKAKESIPPPPSVSHPPPPTQQKSPAPPNPPMSSAHQCQHKSSPPPTLPKPNSNQSHPGNITAPSQPPPPPPAPSSTTSSLPPQGLPKHQVPPPPLRMTSTESTASSGVDSCNSSPLHVPIPPPMAPITPKLPPPTLPKSTHSSIPVPSGLANNLKSPPKLTSPSASPHNQSQIPTRKSSKPSNSPSPAKPGTPSMTNTSSLPHSNRQQSLSEESSVCPPQSPSLPFLSELSKRTHHDSESQSGVDHHNGQNGQQHRRSASAGGGVQRGGKAPPPPPPKRSENTRLSVDIAKQSSPGPEETVQNGASTTPHQDPIYENYDGIMDIDELPPPPPELLEGLAMPGGSGKKPKPPPPPPKRSKDTHLSSQ